MKDFIIFINFIRLLVEIQCKCTIIDTLKYENSFLTAKFWDSFIICEKNYCKKCEVCDSNNNIKCLFCKAGYYKNEITNRCYKKNNKNDQNIIEGCHPNCLIRNSTLESNMNCILCKENYYKINGTNMCFNNSLLNEGFYFKDNLFYQCDENCLTCSDGKDEISNNCLSCDSEYRGLYLLEDKNNCEYSNFSGYYFQEDSKILKKCYNSCKTCKGPYEFDSYTNIENHNCIDCADNYYKLKDGSFPNNCYDFIIKELKNETNFPEMIENNTDNIEYSIQDIKNQILNYEKNEKGKLTKEEKIKYYDEILENIETLFTSEVYNTSGVDSGKDEIIKTEKLINFYI